MLYLRELYILVNPYKILRITRILNEGTHWEHDVVSMQEVANIFYSRDEELQFMPCKGIL